MRSNTATSCGLMSLLNLKDTWSNVMITVQSNITINEADDIWTDGENIYYDSSYVLDKSTSTWKTKTWNNAPSNLSTGVWTDGTNIYYSWTDDQLILDKSTSTWKTKTWNEINTKNFFGNAIWTDGTDIYHTYNSNICVLNRETDTWEEIDLGVSSLWANTDFWTDGTNIYFSLSSKHYIFNKGTKTLEQTQWLDTDGNSVEFWGYDVWTDGTNIYLSKDDGSNYILDKDNNVWEKTSWQGVNSFDGDEVWTDGTNIYVVANPKSRHGQTLCILLPTTAKLYSRQYLCREYTYNWVQVCNLINAT